MVTNQDGLGTKSFPEDTFWPVHNLIIETLNSEGIVFEDVIIDRSFPADNAPTRKPRIGLLNAYLDSEKYDLANSYVIGDRLTDIELAKNLNAQGIFISTDEHLAADESTGDLNNFIALKTKNWKEIYELITSD